MKIFICDNCQKQFSQPLDEEMYKDENGNWKMLDLCAPCRKSLKEQKSGVEKTFFDKALKGKK